MKIKSMFLMVASAIGGIYLTSPEGKKAREALKKKKSSFEPIIKELIKQTGSILSGATEINSDEVRANVTSMIRSAKKQLLNIDLEQSLETIQEAIKVSSRKIRKAYNETNKVTSTRKKITKTKAKAKTKTPTKIQSKTPTQK